MTATQDWSDLSLMGLFRLEVETQVDALNQQLLNLERLGWGDRRSLDALMRAAHSIKGAARIVQIEPAVKVAHALEDCFIAAQQGTLVLSAHHVDVLLTGVDFLMSLGLIEEAVLAEQLPAYDVDADAVVLAIEALVANAEYTSRQSISQTSANQSHPGQSHPGQSNESSSDVLSYVEPTAQIESYGENYGVISESIDSYDDPLGYESSDLSESFGSPVETSARMIRISAENLNHLMGLAGESLVEANWLQPFSRSLLQLKRRQQAVIALLEKQSLNAIDSSNNLKRENLKRENLKRENLKRENLKRENLKSENLNSALQTRQHDYLQNALQEMQACHNLLNDQLSDLDLFSRRFGQRSERLYREVIAAHMCAFEEGTRGYGRLVRDLARTLGKQVSLEIVGLNTQVDRDILARLDVPITHLLTNAVVHGIELPEVRLAQGKSAEGKLCLRAMHRSGMLIVSVEDDGRGVAYVDLRQKIVDKGLVTADVANYLSESELIEFLFLPGFSTAAQVDQMAGRGYGLDLVRTMAQSVGGSLQATSPAFEDDLTGRVGGMRFQFQLPLTLSVVRSLLFEVVGELYAISLARTVRVVKLSPEQIHTSENRPYFSLHSTEERNLRSAEENGHAVKNTPQKENISLVFAHQVLALNHAPDLAINHTTQQAQTLSVIVIGEPGNRYGLCVDRLLEEKDLVVRPLDSRLGKVPNISAAALTEQGMPILIIDVADMIRSAEKVATGNSTWTKTAFAADVKEKSTAKFGDKPQTPKRVLIVDDSMTVRAMEKKLLQNRGYLVEVAVDGAEGWNMVRVNSYDLVITDVDMPRMNGIELIKKMRAYEPTQKLPVIVVSYKDRAEDQISGLNAGANYYLTKSSFHDDGLINAVVDLIGSSVLPSRF